MLDHQRVRDEERVPASLQRAAELVRPAMERAASVLNDGVRLAVDHHLAGGGKGVRSALVFVSAEAFGAPAEIAVPGAVALELVHNYSLIHDDIIDGDEERRHRPTVWSKFGVGEAIIAGDSLATLAMQVILEDPTPQRVRASSTLAAATQEMISGQAYDMAFETRPWVTVDECLQMERGKTGALFSCATAIGSILGGAGDAEIEAMAGFGHFLGAAFQAVDDVLGIWGEPEITGKPAGNDLVSHKKSLPISMALAAAGDRRGHLLELLNMEQSPQVTAELTELLAECGGRASALSFANDQLTAAVDTLKMADLAPGPVDELLKIAEFVTARDR